MHINYGITSHTPSSLSLSLITLLGHNGAGKSSVISMITGLTPISSGECTIYGNPLPSALNTIRTMTGICPQQNVLFPSLTVREHLRYFGSIKSLCGKKLSEEVERMISDVGLLEKTDTPASFLSGGMKRKLQLAMALIGGSKFVLLDEPTSGRDRHMHDLSSSNNCNY
jgi:ATP-binding cassette subfamily A (ABC1) protein 3